MWGTTSMPTALPIACSKLITTFELSFDAIQRRADLGEFLTVEFVVDLPALPSRTGYRPHQAPKWGGGGLRHARSRS